MFSMPILDIAIGLSFFYLLLGLLCTVANEIIAGSRSTRAKFLDKGIERLLGGDSDLKRKLYEHPLIQALAPSEKQARPSYIPADKFATALLDVLSGPEKPLTDAAAVREGAKSRNKSVQTTITALIDKAQGDSALLHKNVEAWFDDGMDRVSGWYKRNAQRNSLILAALVTLVLNADTINVARILWTNPAVRAAVVDEARVRASQKPPEAALPLVSYDNPNNATASTPHPQSPDDSSDQALTPKEQELLGQLTGWDPDRKKFNASSGFLSWLWLMIYSHGIGWIITALAVSMGAPFWFDTLNRFMNVRNAGRAPGEPRDKSTSPASQAAGA